MASDRFKVQFGAQYDAGGEIVDPEQPGGVIRHGIEVDRTAKVNELLKSGVIFEEGAANGPLTADAIHGATVSQVQENLENGTWSLDDVERLEAEREGGARVGITRHLEKIRNVASESTAE